MNMNIAGCGNIPAGEYEKISVSGSGKLHGSIRCSSFSSSGSSKGERIECSDSFKVAGSSHFTDNVKAKKVSLAGSFKCDGSITADEKISCAGSVKCLKNIKCDLLSVGGTLVVGGDIEAETVKADGTLNCEGLLNAENIEIKFHNELNIGSIGGSKIVIMKNESKKAITKLPLFSSIVKSTVGQACITSSIEGDEIALEHISCPRVTGRVVAIGEGCNIDLIQYSEDIEISPDATVLKYEKI